MTKYNTGLFSQIFKNKKGRKEIKKKKSSSNKPQRKMLQPSLDYILGCTISFWFSFEKLLKKTQDLRGTCNTDNAPRYPRKR